MQTYAGPGEAARIPAILEHRQRIHPRKYGTAPYLRFMHIHNGYPCKKQGVSCLCSLIQGTLREWRVKPHHLRASAERLLSGLDWDGR